MPALYKHKDNRDVAIEVLKSFYIEEKDTYSLKVTWWNIGKTHKPYCTNYTERFKISRDIWRNDWQLYNESDR